MENKNLNKTKSIGTGLSMIIFPIMLLVGYVTHPNLLSLKMVTDVETWVAEFHGNTLFHFGHLIVFLAVPFIIVALSKIIFITAEKPGAWLGFIGGVLGIFGAVILACDKGALTLTLTAFDKLPESEFTQIYPALRVLQQRAGMLAIVWLLPLLSIGGLIQAIGLLKSKAVPAWQAIMIIIGMIIMLNPDIEILSTFAAIFTAIGFIPIGVQVMRKNL